MKCENPYTYVVVWSYVVCVYGDVYVRVRGDVYVRVRGDVYTFTGTCIHICHIVPRIISFMVALPILPSLIIRKQSREE